MPKIRGTFEGHTTGGPGLAAVAALVLIIGAGLTARDGSRLGRDAAHAAGIFIAVAMAVTAAVVTVAVTLVVAARRHEARWMAEHRRTDLAGPAQLPPHSRAAAPPARREIHVYHHLDGLPPWVAQSPVTAEVLRGEVLDGERDR